MNITVIGAGVIGISWTALFAAHGHEVTVHDTAPDVDERVRDGLARLIPTLRMLGLDTSGLPERVRCESDLAAAVRAADVIQENGPERRDFKVRLWRDVEKHARAEVLMLSSSSGTTATEQAAGMRDPSRLLIGHPFNPPHLIPLVEVVPGEKTSEDAVREAIDFYASLGKTPIRLRREIPGFVANRIQAAVFRESVALVRAGVVTVSELDDIVTNSLGPRWATAGPFRSFHLGGGPRGFRGFLEHFATGMQLLWLHAAVRPVLLTPGLRRKLLAQIDESFGSTPYAEAEKNRDRQQVAVLEALAAQQN
ncbi:3-hydroxyacyl-CoA dehydrogenase NAD-binding domain-containing protein [Nocardia sp. NPDC003693]